MNNKISNLAILFTTMLVILAVAMPVLADNRNNDEMDSPETITGLTIEGHVDYDTDRYDYYILTSEDIGLNPTITLTDDIHGDADMVIYVDDEIVKAFNATSDTETHEVAVEGTIILRVKAFAFGAASYEITIEPGCEVTVESL